ncbi:MAG: toll/interleukin-1 receptor domain-containing protein [Bacteroidales bacterium]|nr:toll/interleukin-1 receptor domain-containing protein [Bacteroidales bacterium]
MFVPFKIKISEIDKLQNLDLDFLTTQNECKYFCKKILNHCTDEYGIIDGAKLSSISFPFDKDYYDVFISYSHVDKEKANYLYSYLKKQCNLDVFLDSTIWNSADQLLKIIDNEYCKGINRHIYDYKKRNFSTSHVHTMLSMAMMEAIKRSELFLFIESENSLTLCDGINNSTLSPWIYQECLFSKYIKKDIPQGKYSNLKCFSKEITESFNSNLKIEYKLDINDFYIMNFEDLKEISEKGLYCLYQKKGI